MTAVSDSTPQVRPVTAAESEAFYENGWVKLPGLISRAAAAHLLQRAKARFGEDARSGLEPKAATDRGWFRSQMSPDDAAFLALAKSEELGHNVARMFGRDSAIRMMLHSLSAKLPSDSERGKATDFHQDTAQHMFFEGNSLNVWVALDEVTPEMGALQFYTGSHRCGNMGNLLDPKVRHGWDARLAKSCQLTPPIALQPGDATVHTNLMIHGTGPNLSERVRWSWIGMFLPADVRYTGASSYYTDGLGLKPFGPIDHPKFPVIYQPAA